MTHTSIPTKFRAGDVVEIIDHPEFGPWTVDSVGDGTVCLQIGSTVSFPRPSDQHRLVRRADGSLPVVEAGEEVTPAAASSPSPAAGRPAGEPPSPVRRPVTPESVRAHFPVEGEVYARDSSGEKFRVGHVTWYALVVPLETGNEVVIDVDALPADCSAITTCRYSEGDPLPEWAPPMPEWFAEATRDMAKGADQ